LLISFVPKESWMLTSNNWNGAVERLEIEYL
jgi:hypothetical protein